MFRFRNQREAELWEDCVRVLILDEELGVDHACCLADDVVEQFRKRQPDPIPDAGPTMRAVPWAQTEARLEAQREPGPAAPGKEVA